MSNIFREVDILRKKGKLHNNLIVRTYALIFIALAMAGIVSYNIAFRELSFIAAFALGAVGYILGRYVFSRMSVVDWDEDKEVVRVGKMDIVGVVVLIAYIGFDFILKAVLTDFYPGSVTVGILAAFFGTLLGRAVGMAVEVHRVFKANK